MPRLTVYSLLVYLFSVLPLFVLYILSDFLYLLLYHIFGYRKAVVRENLRNSFPDKTDPERRVIEKRFYRHLPDLIVESVKMRTISAREVEKRVRMINPEELSRHLDAGRAVVVVTAHYGNWEWGLHRLSLLIKYPLLIIYKPLNNISFDQLFNWIRSRFGAIMTPMKQALRQVLLYRYEPHVSVFVSDQSPTYQESDYFIPFLNQTTLVYTGAPRIAQRLNAPMVYCHIDKVSRGYYTCTFETLEENSGNLSIEALTDLYNRYVEQIIRNKPEWWLWSHRRWKRQPVETK